MSSVKPSRKIFFLVFACMIGVGAIGFAVYATNARSESVKNTASVADRNSETTQLIQKTLKESGEKDDDSDGLVNWEENLWSTDRSNPDTDKDGTQDGEEVKLGRNPLIAGPEDKLQDGINSETKTAAAKTVLADKTVTGEISRELFTNYMRVKQSGAAVDEQLQNQILEQTFNNKNFDLNYKTYKPEDIITSPSDDLKAYGNSLGLALYSGRTKDKTNEVEVLYSALTKNNQEDIKKLDPIVADYTTMLNALALVSVPKDEIAYHLNLLNSTSRLIGDIQGFRQIFTDPLVGLKAFGNYYADLEGVQKAIGNIKTEFELKHITFDESEYGRVFMQTLQ